MNNELKEATKKLNNFILETNKIKDTSEEWHGYMNDELHELKRTVEIVLKAVENSIPKKIVEEKIKELDELIVKTQKELGSASKEYTIYVYQKSILQELQAINEKCKELRRIYDKRTRRSNKKHAKFCK